jgi:hypothetical protein
MVDCRDAHADRMHVQRSWSAFLQPSFNVSTFVLEAVRYLAALLTQIFIRRFSIASTVSRAAGKPILMEPILMENDTIQAEVAKYLFTPVWI